MPVALPDPEELESPAHLSPESRPLWAATVERYPVAITARPEPSLHRRQRDEDRGLVEAGRVRQGQRTCLARRHLEGQPSID